MLLYLLNDAVGLVLGWKLCINCGKKVRADITKTTRCPVCGSRRDTI